MTQQLELTNQTRVTDETDPRIQRIIDFLDTARGWVKRDEVFQAAGVSDRVGRAMLELTGGLVISNSAKGYRHTLHATDDEVAHFIHEMESREHHHQKRRRAVELVRQTRAA